MVRKMLRGCFTFHISLKALSILDISISVVHNIKRSPMPRNIPFLVCTRYEFTNPIIVSAASGCDDRRSRNQSSIYTEYPKPLATAKNTARIGTKASSEEYVRLLAVAMTRFWVISVTKARMKVYMVFRKFIV